MVLLNNKLELMTLYHQRMVFQIVFYIDDLNSFYRKPARKPLSL